MNWYEITFLILAFVALFVVVFIPISDEPDESHARVRYNQTRPEAKPIYPSPEKIIPSQTSALISQKRFDKVSPSQVAQLNEDYLKLIQRLNDEVIF